MTSCNTVCNAFPFSIYFQFVFPMYKSRMLCEEFNISQTEATIQIQLKHYAILCTFHARIQKYGKITDGVFSKNNVSFYRKHSPPNCCAVLLYPRLPLVLRHFQIKYGRKNIMLKCARLARTIFKRPHLNGSVSAMCENKEKRNSSGNDCWCIYSILRCSQYVKVDLEIK